MFPTIDDTERAVRRLFPPYARCVVLPVTDRCTTPYPGELDAVAGAVSARRSEFVCGRACAHAALQSLGAVDAPIAMASTREPVWPSGIVGSISHTRTLAAAVVCRSSDALAVGLDLERADQALDAGSRRLVLTTTEIARVDALRGLEVRAAVLIFSAKECVYKVTAPLWGLRLDHQDVEVAIDLASRRFAARVRAPLGNDAWPPGDAAGALHGSFDFVNDHVVTGICLGRQSQ